MSGLSSRGWGCVQVEDSVSYSENIKVYAKTPGNCLSECCHTIRLDWEEIEDPMVNANNGQMR